METLLDSKKSSYTSFRTVEVLKEHYIEDRQAKFQWERRAIKEEGK